VKRHNFAEVDDTTTPPAAGDDCCNGGVGGPIICDLPSLPAVDVSSCAELHAQVGLEWCPCEAPDFVGGEV
jgi:hypothetical protein